MTQYRRARVGLTHLYADATGLLVVVALALLAVTHISLTARGDLLYFNGDSVLPEIFIRSLAAGEHFRWMMSPVLFFAPELPVYAVVSTVTASAKSAMFFSAIASLVLLYAVLRVLAKATFPALSTARQVVLALVPFVFVVACTLTESSGLTGTLELVSLILPGTYYYGSILAMGATLAGAVLAIDPGTRSPRRSALVLSFLFVVSTVSTASNPLYAMWVVAPLAAVTLLLLLLHRVRWTNAALLVVAVGVGVGFGLALRIPLSRFMTHTASSYFNYSQMGASVSFYFESFRERMDSEAGRLELLMLTVALIAIGASLVHAIKNRDVRGSLLLAFGILTVISTTIGAVVVGSVAPRYLMPMYFAPTFALVAATAIALERFHAVEYIRQHARKSTLAVTATVLAAVLLVVVIPTGRKAAAIVAEPYRPATCLSDWIDGRDISGVGQFWAIRTLLAYGNDTIDLKQVYQNLYVYPWLVNLASYEQAEITYVVSDATSQWPIALDAMVGPAAAVIDCGSFIIFDYTDTEGANILTDRLRESTEDTLEMHGFTLDRK